MFYMIHIVKSESPSMCFQNAKALVLSIVIPNIVKHCFHVCLTVGLKWVEEECNKFF